MSLLPRLHIFARLLLSSSLSPFCQNGGRQVMTRIGMNACSLSSAAEASDFECHVTHDDVKAADKYNALCLADSQLASEFSKKSMLSLQKIFGVRRAHVISTGSLKLDLALGIGGLPKINQPRNVDLWKKSLVVENALRFYAAVRLILSRMRLIKTEDKVEGVMICAQVVKNKLAPAATKRAELGIKFGRGFCHESNVLDLACENGIIVKHEGSYFIEGSSLDSREAAELFLAQNDAVCDKLVRDMRRLYF